jgi:FkbM family methyltransferase
LFDQFGYRLQRVDRLNFFEPLLYRRLAKAPNFFFVQIGANDGVFADPIRPFVTRNQVAGLVVEPLQDMFTQLVANYRSYPKVTPVKAAIHATLKSVEMYRVDPAKAAHLGDWAQGIGSVRKDHHVNAGVPAEAMLTETVSCVTLEELLQQHAVDAVDLLQIDTEGYDSEILRMIDFGRRKPAIIRFEHGLPSGIMSPAEFKECAGFLIDKGYFIVTEHFDAVAYLPEML